MNKEEKNVKPDSHYWLFGLYTAFIVTAFVYAVISLFTFLWWTGAIILFIYLWAACTLHFYMQDKNKEQ